MNKHLEFFSGLKGELNNAPKEVKESYNALVKYFDRTDNELLKDAKEFFSGVSLVQVSKLKIDDIIFYKDNGSYECYWLGQDESKGTFLVEVKSVIIKPQSNKKGEYKEGDKISLASLEYKNDPDTAYVKVGKLLNKMPDWFK